MKKFAALLLSFAMVLSLAACGGGSTTTTTDDADGAEDASGGETIVLRASSSTAPDHAYNLGLEKFAELVDEGTNGAVQIDIFPNSSLGDERANIEDLQMGTLDIAVSSTGPLGNFVSDFLILDLPFLFTSYEHAHAVLDGEIGQNLIAKLDDIGIVGGAFWENGFREMTNSIRPINTPEDCAGLKLRGMTSDVYIKTFEALDAAPIGMQFSELFSALQQGAVDGQDNGMLLTYDSKFNEVQGYYTDLGHVQDVSIIFVSEPVWQSLSADDQALLQQAADEAVEHNRNL